VNLTNKLTSNQMNLFTECDILCLLCL